MNTFDSEISFHNKNYSNLKSENYRLLSQNVKLITKLEEITCQFSKACTKIKDLESKESNKISSNGNLSTLLDKIKILEADNRHLCEELKDQINANVLNSSFVKDQDDMLNETSQKSFPEEKILSMKTHIYELQQQLVKTQKIAFENECNYKECQIETLEALKFCEIDKHSLASKIFNLEEAARNVLVLHQENFDLKTSLNECKEEVLSSRNECKKVMEKALAAEESVKDFKAALKSSENKLISSEQKVRELSSENECLLKTLEQLTEEGVQGKMSVETCEGCQERGIHIQSLQERLDENKVHLEDVEREKEQLWSQVQEQRNIVQEFENNQSKLRAQLNDLVKSDSGYKSLISSKDQEADNLRCQLSSVQQRLDLRDQRLNEMAAQLSKSVANESRVSSSMDLLSETTRLLEKDLHISTQKLSQSMKENGILSADLESHKLLCDKNHKFIHDLTTEINEKGALNEKLQSSLATAEASLKALKEESSSKIISLNHTIDQVNYSIKIYLKEVEKLEQNLIVAHKELDMVQKERKQEEESYHNSLTVLQTQLDNNSATIKKYIADLEMRDLEIKNFSRNIYEMERNIKEKDEQIELSSLQLIDVKKELKDKLLNFELLVKQNNEFIKECSLNQQMKYEMNEKIKENKQLKHSLTETNLKLDMLNRSLLEGKERMFSEDCKMKDMCSKFETLQFKFVNIEKELENKKSYIKELEEKNQSETKGLLDRLEESENEKNNVFSKLVVAENMKENYDKDYHLSKIKIDDLQNIIGVQKMELESCRVKIASLETDIISWKDVVKNNQMIIVERSRDIDRLEQMVRDRTEQIETRSEQLRRFEVELEIKLKEMELQAKESQDREDKLVREMEELSFCKNTLMKDYKSKEEQLKEKTQKQEEMEREKSDIMKISQEHKKENQSLHRDLELLKKELASKMVVVKDLLQEIRNKDKELSDVTEKLVEKESDVAAKAVFIKKINNQMKENRRKFGQIEVKLYTELSSVRKKLEIVEKEFQKSNNEMNQKCEVECEKYVKELSIRNESLLKLSKEVDDLSERLSQSREEVVKVKMDLETYKAVLVDTESNCRLKEVVIERLLQKLNMDSLRSYTGEFKDLENMPKSKKEILKEKSLTMDIYEEVSLQELMKRISKTLDCENTRISK